MPEDCTNMDISRMKLVDRFDDFNLTIQHQRGVYETAIGRFQMRYAYLLDEVRFLDPKLEGFAPEEIMAAAGDPELEPNSYAAIVKYLSILWPKYLELKELRRKLVRDGGGRLMAQAAYQLNELNELDRENQYPFTEDLYIPSPFASENPPAKDQGVA